MATSKDVSNSSLDEKEYIDHELKTNAVISNGSTSYVTESASESNSLGKIWVKVY